MAGGSSFRKSADRQKVMDSLSEQYGMPLLSPDGTG